MFISNVSNLNDVALIESNGSILTYADLYKSVSEFRTFFDDKHLVFIIGENNLATIICYLSAVESEMVPLLLSSKINQNQLNNLLDVYKPKYIFQNKSRPSNDLDLLSSFGEYGFFIRSKSKSIKLHPNLALLLTTSGSTGSPKLVRLTKKNLISNAKSISEYLDINSNDRAITSLPYNYSYGLSVINTHLSSGGSLVLTNASMMEGNFWRLVKKYSVTSFAGVPYSYEMILRLGVDKLEISSINKMTQAGGRLDTNIIEKINNSLKSKNIKFYVMYGQTEATARMSYLPPEDIERKPDSIGIAIPNGKLWIEDSKGHIIEQSDNVGELIYSGENVSMGYAKSIIDLESGDKNAGILKTGDLAKFDSEGYFSIEGSNNRFVKLFGNRISLDSLEKIVSNKGFESVATGDDKKIVIHIINNPNLSQDSLRSSISEVIGINHVAININVISEFPRLDNGKIDYKFLSNNK
jgi:long-chain acyl-CoA synthetase